MKILFISDNFPPESNAPAIRTFEHCKRWVEFGADISVLTCASNFPNGKVFEGYKNKIFQRSEKDNIKIIRVWSYITKNEGFFRRILDYFSFSLTSFLAGLFEEFDVVISTSPQFFTSFSGFLLSRIKRKKWVFEVRDLWPDTIAAVGSIRRESILYKILERIELGLYKRADTIIVVTNSFKKDLIKRGISSNKIQIVYNGVDKGFISKLNINDRLEIRNKLKLNSKIIIGYIGTIGLSQDLYSLIRKIKLLPPNYHLLMIGSGAAKKQIVEFVKDEKLKNLTILDSIPREHVPNYINALDLSLIHLKKCKTFKNVIPSKIFENAAMNKTIILGVEGESKEILEKYELGFSFEPSNFDSFLLALNKSKTSNSNISKKRKQFLSNFSRDSQAKIFYKKLIES